MNTRLTRRNVADLAILFTGLGVLEFFYHYLDAVARDRARNWLVPFIEEMTSVYGVLVLLLLVVRPMALSVRPDKQPLARWVPRHIGVLLTFSLLHTTWNWAARSLCFPLVGLGPYDYGRMQVRYLMELPSDVIVYSISVAIVVGLARLHESRDRDVRIARLESDLARAQLDALALQLQPHFLFNALNAVSAAIYEDPRKADLMLARVSDLLRRMLEHPDAQEVPLDRELETVNLYLSVMKARFEDTLEIAWRVDRTLDDVLVPPWILQPIVENAVRHGMDPASSRIVLELGATTRNGSLVLSVRDHGRGVVASAPGGVGLANTRGRLERLYGDAAHLELGNAAGGGAEARIELPLRRRGRA